MTQTPAHESASIAPSLPVASGLAMNRFVVSFCSFICASAGWWIGEQFGGIFTAFVISMIGTGIGIYAGKRVISHWDV